MSLNPPLVGLRRERLRPLGSTVRAAGGWALAACAAAQPLVVLVLGAGTTTTATGIRAMRVAAFVGALCVGWAQDDPARELTRTLPLGAGRMRLHRVAIAGMAAAAGWALAALAADRVFGGVPLRDLAVEALAYGALALACSASLADLMPERRGGIALPAALGAVVVGASLLHPPLQVTDPSSGAWLAAQRGHRVLAGAGLVWFVVAVRWVDLRWAIGRRPVEHHVPGPCVGPPG